MMLARSVSLIQCPAAGLRRALRCALAIVLVLIAGTVRAQGTPGAFGTYYDNIDFTGTTVTRVDPSISFDWANGVPAGGIGSDTFSVRWTGSILIPTTGAYTFYTQSDDGVRLWIDCGNDGALDTADRIINNWTDHSTAENSGSCATNLTAGVYYRFQMEFYENGGQAVAKLSWSGPGLAAGSAGNRNAIPAGNGVRGLYSGFIDNTPPTIAGTVGSCSNVTVTFSEPVTEASATNLAHYSISPGVAISNATLGADNRTVTLTTSALLPGTTYTLTVSGVQDRAVPANTIVAGSTGSFVPGGNGLLGQYYDQAGVQRAYFTGNSLTRIDSNVDFDWSTGVPATGFAADDFSVRWTGYVVVPTTGAWRFHTVTDDGVRLWVNGAQVIDNWSDHSSTVDSSGTINLTAGTFYAIQREMFERGGFAEARLQWTGPGVATRTAVPSGNLYTCIPPSLDNFGISVGTGTASTCAVRNVQITARNVLNQAVTGYGGTVQITTSTSRGDWSTVTAAGALANGVADDGAATYTFSATDAGTVTLGLTHTLAQNVTVTVSDPGTPSASRTSVVIPFSDNAFVFAEDLSSRIAGSDVAVAGRDHDYRVTLMRRDPANGNQCGVATSYSGARTIRGSITRDGLDPGGTAPAIGAVSLPNATATVNVPLTFTAGVATFSLATTDVGKYAINFTDDTTPNLTAPVSGSSNPLTVRPFGLHATVTGNPGVNTPTGALFTSAGTNFAGTVRGVRWQAADDANNDGVPDSAANLADNATTTRYAWATTLVAATPYEPAAGVLGLLAGGSLTPANFAAGCAGCSGSPALNALSYSEVGSFTLRASATGYLGAAGANLTDSGGFVVGRFTPFDFGVGYNTPRFDPGCSAGAFTYLGQPFNYASGAAPQLTVTARSRSGSTTVNYRGIWWRITNASLRPAAFDTQAKRYTAFTGTLDLSRLPDTTADPVIVAAGNGTGTLTFSGGTGVAFVRATPVPPFDADIALGLNVLDLDNVAFASNPARFGTATANGGIAFGGTRQQRFGRLRIANAVASPVLSVPVTVAAEYWNGTGFVLNGDDSCTRLTNTQFAFGNYSGGLAACNTSGSPVGANAITFTALSRGQASNFRLSPPGAGRSGSVDLALNLGTAATGQTCSAGAAAAATAAGLTWLQGNWGGAAAWDRNPVGRISFGQFGGSTDLIYRRESY
ncbi:MAG: Ig-like domain-containing protein [Burkholderiales bacterium]|nr:Ig-like domain-containing protein [Burkholderiales bacterium]